MPGAADLKAGDYVGVSAELKGTWATREEFVAACRPVIEAVRATGVRDPYISLYMRESRDTETPLYSLAVEGSYQADMTAEQLRDYMNRYLPDDIIVQEVREASMRFHARYNAIGKTYCYTVFDGKTKPLFDRKYVWQLEKPVNIERMQKAAEYLIGEHDFMSFCKNPQKKKSTVRSIESILFEQNGADIRISFRGDGFLFHMVRILTGTLVEVGLGVRRPEEIAAILDGKDRQKAGMLAPASGLCLMEVYYQ